MDENLKSEHSKGDGQLQLSKCVIHGVSGDEVTLVKMSGDIKVRLHKDTGLPQHFDFLIERSTQPPGGVFMHKAGEDLQEVWAEFEAALLGGLQLKVGDVIRVYALVDGRATPYNAYTII